MDIGYILNNAEMAITHCNVGHARRLLHHMRAIVADNLIVSSLVDSALSDLNRGNLSEAKNDVNTANIVNQREQYTMSM